MPRHLHVTPYAAIVIAGCYEETGWFGRAYAAPGTVLMHSRFDMHLDRFKRRAQILNLELENDCAAGLGAIDNVDDLVRLAERDAKAATESLLETLRPAARPAAPDWPELLAKALKADRPVDIGAWAREAGITPETATRGFLRVFGVTPARFRSEWRCRRALLAMTTSPAPLSAVAVAAGFADQPHMTRQIRNMTGRTPGQWCRIGRG